MDPWVVLNEALIVFVVALIGLLAWYARAWLQEKLSNEQYSFVLWLAAMAVQAAEQYGGSAEEKKRQALAVAERWLEERGLKLDLNSLDAAIEAAVFSELTKHKQVIDG